MFSIRTILHPTDFSETSRYALGLASALATDHDASLVIVHVVARPMVLPDGILFPPAEDDPAALREELDYLEVPDHRIGVVRWLEEGNAAVEILNLAQLCHADLIVMGAHRRRGLASWSVGSVAEAVRREATCPVLVVATPVHRAARSPLTNQLQTAPP